MYHFHGLCREFSQEAGLGYRSSQNQQEMYNNVLPNMLLEAIDELGDDYRLMQLL